VRGLNVSSECTRPYSVFAESVSAVVFCISPARYKKGRGTGLPDHMFMTVGSTIHWGAATSSTRIVASCRSAVLCDRMCPLLLTLHVPRTVW